MTLQDNEVFAFIKTSIDVHTLGISSILNYVRECGYAGFLSPDDIQMAVTDIKKLNNFGLFRKWLVDNGVTRIGFSYRLDPKDGRNYFCQLYYALKDHRMFEYDGGPIRGISFAGLPDTCDLVKAELGDAVLLFPGDETPVESLRKYGVPKSRLPRNLTEGNRYDNMRTEFATTLIANETYKYVLPQNHYGYRDCGTDHDSYIGRLKFCREHGSLPIIRAHMGPYNPNRVEGVREFCAWTKEMADSHLLDVLSIGSSQLTQSNFGEDWEGRPNGGGVPINSETEYMQIAAIAKPMLVRTYAGTKDVPGLAQMHERSLNISWHALSFWWFCEIDGRGKNSVLNNLKEHIETIKYVASTGKPLEPNVPHHFAFRGADDITYIVSAYLAAKTAKKYGIHHLILQNMLNTPKYTSGIQDLAKGRAMLKLIRELEDSSFSVSLQARAGLDFFAPDIEKAKVQLAAVTALMDDIEPNNSNSPEIIHVVSYSEAIRLATPPIVKESIKITLAALQEYRRLRSEGVIPNMAYDIGTSERTAELYEEAKDCVHLLERYFPDLYTPEGLFTVFKNGFLPVPYLIEQRHKYPDATRWNTAYKKGGVYVVDEEGNIIDSRKRYRQIIEQLNR